MIDEEVLWNVTRIGAATTGCQNQALGDKLGRSEIFRTKSPRNSIGKGVCFLTKKANLIKLLLSVAYRFSLLKSRPQLYRSYTEFAALPRPRGVLAVTCLVSLRCARPSDTRALSCQHSTTPLWPVTGTHCCRRVLRNVITIASSAEPGTWFGKCVLSHPTSSCL